MKNKYAVAIKNIKTFLNKIGRKDINKENMQIAIFSFLFIHITTSKLMITWTFIKTHH